MLYDYLARLFGIWNEKNTFKERENPCKTSNRNGRQTTYHLCLTSNRIRFIFSNAIWMKLRENIARMQNFNVSGFRFD